MWPYLTTSWCLLLVERPKYLSEVVMNYESPPIACEILAQQSPEL